MPYQVLKNIVLTVIDVAVIFRVFFVLLSWVIGKFASMYHWPVYGYLAFLFSQL